jgi:hypothetical protein
MVGLCHQTATPPRARQITLASRGAISQARDAGPDAACRDSCSANDCGLMVTSSTPSLEAVRTYHGRVTNLIPHETKADSIATGNDPPTVFKQRPAKELKLRQFSIALLQLGQE